MINTHFPTIFYSLLLSIFLRLFYVYCIRAVENALLSRAFGGGPAGENQP